MAETERSRGEALARAERRIVEALAGVDALLDPSAAPASGSGLRMIVAERQVRELVQAAHDVVVGVLAQGSLPASDERRGVALLHSSHAVAAMCDEYVDISRFDGVPDADDTHVTDALASMREMSRGQVRTAADALARRDEGVASRLRRAHAAIEALNREVSDHGLVTDDGTVRRESLSSAVLTAECLTRVSERAVDIGDLVIIVARGPATTGHSPV